MAGFISFYNTNKNKDTLDLMLNRIKHRGKDYSIKYEDDQLSLGYNGMDLSYKFDRQELYEDEDLLVLVNGYISNIDYLYETCKKELNTEILESPAKMIADLYKIKNKDVANDLKGGYIVTIYEKTSHKLTFIRDRFSIQPIYYYKTEKGLIVVSETKALLDHPDFKKELNKDALVPYLVFQSPSTIETFFKGVFTLPPASILEYKDNKIDISIYWDINFESKNISIDEAIETIDKLVDKSIEEKTKYFEDKSKIGQFLSGGVDSSYLASKVRPEKTFTVGYDDKEFSEIDNAKDLSEIIGAKHYSKIIDSNSSFESIEEIAYMCDMPFANLSAVPMYMLSKDTEKEANAVFSGEGADELFGGYHEYTEPKYMNIYKKFPKFFRKFLGEKMLHTNKDFKGKNFIIKGLPVEDHYIGQAKIFHENEARDIVKDEYKTNIRIKDLLDPYFEKVKDKTDLQKKQYLDFHMWMANDIALKADRMNIGNHVQLITPLLDEDLVDFARIMPDDLKIKDNKVKLAFRETALLHLPEEWAKRKKKGYVVPVRNWLKEDRIKKIIEDKLTSDTAKMFFNVDQVKELIEINASGKRPLHRKIWTIYMFLVWYEIYFESDKI